MNAVVQFKLYVVGLYMTFSFCAYIRKLSWMQVIWNSIISWLNLTKIHTVPSYLHCPKSSTFTVCFAICELCRGNLITALYLFLRFKINFELMIRINYYIYRNIRTGDINAFSFFHFILFSICMQLV